MQEIVSSYDNANEYIFYLSNNKLSKDNVKTAIGHIECDLTFDYSYQSKNGTKYINGLMYIVSMYVQERHRNKGYGSKLLKKVISLCKKLNIKKIMVDDKTSRYRKKRNIYVNHEFKYSNNKYGPEMTRIL